MSQVCTFVIVWGMAVFLFLAGVDAYEYETTGECHQCLILKPWFEMRAEA